MEGKKRKKEKPLIHRNLRCDSEVKKTKKKQTKKRYCYVETRATVNVSTTTTMKKKKCERSSHIGYGVAERHIKKKELSSSNYTKYNEERKKKKKINNVRDFQLNAHNTAHKKKKKAKGKGKAHKLERRKKKIKNKNRI